MITDSSSRYKVLAVTKGRSAAEIVKLLRENPVLFRIGENRVEEASEKFEELRILLGDRFERLEKYFIGKLQSRKIKDVARLFDGVQSVENLEQAQKLSDAALKLGKTLRIYIEVNVSGLSQRSGVSPEAFKDLLEAAWVLPGLKVEGVMGMATREPELARQQFRLLKSLQGALPECSMGMSQDYVLAIEEGATLLRLGTVLFEEGLPKGLVFF
ncbi:YggS family pyridoxal phosphate-dependent enzyme [Candidatus Peregrinibacteria bacterium]|nr:MAG: YggS family pyridoxal phosphate-dependent enzyme [Candidatus Peregrinibacteria bacterium]